eukprot:jgi/Chlat1/13/ChrspC225077S00898
MPPAAAAPAHESREEQEVEVAREGDGKRMTVDEFATWESRKEKGHCQHGSVGRPEDSSLGFEAFVPAISSSPLTPDQSPSLLLLARDTSVLSHAEAGGSAMAHSAKEEDQAEEQGEEDEEALIGRGKEGEQRNAARGFSLTLRLVTAESGRRHAV